MALLTKFYKFVTNKSSSDRPTMSRDVNKVVLWPFQRFCFEACPWARNVGGLTAQSKETSASVSKFFDDERLNGWRIQVTWYCPADCFGMLCFEAIGEASTTAFMERRVQGRWGRSRRGRHTTGFLQKCHNFFIFKLFSSFTHQTNCTVLTFSKMHKSQT